MTARVFLLRTLVALVAVLGFFAYQSSGFMNYIWAIGFNLAGIALATAGLLSPWLAALFHHLSSVFVVANSARLIRQ